MAAGIRAWQRFREITLVAVANEAVSRGFSYEREPALNGEEGYLWDRMVPEDVALDYLVSLEAAGFRVDAFETQRAGDIYTSAYREERIPGAQVETVIRVWFNCSEPLIPYPMIDGWTDVPTPAFVGDPDGDGEEGDLFADCSYRA
jgi:hypothetical protein